MQAVFLICAGVGLGWLALALLGGHGHHGAHGPHGSHAHGHHHPAAGHGGLHNLGSPLVLAAALAAGGLGGEMVLLLSPAAILAASLGAVAGLVLGACVSALILDRLIAAQTPELPPADYVGWRGPLLQPLGGISDIAEMMAAAPQGDERRCLRVRLAAAGAPLSRGTLVVVVAETGAGVYAVQSEAELLSQ